MMKTLFYAFLMTLAFGLFSPFSYAQQLDSVVYTLKDTVLAREYLEEADSLIKVQKLDEAFAKVTQGKVIIDQLREVPHISADIYSMIGDIEKKRRNSDASLTAYKKALELYQQKYGREHKSVALSLADIGFYYFSARKYEEAISYFEQVLEVTSAVRGPEHKSVAAFNYAVGICYVRLGEYKKAISRYEKSMELRKKLFGEESKEVAEIYFELGAPYFYQEDYEKAIFYYEKALEIRSKFFEEKSPKITDLLLNLGALYENIGQRKKAMNYQYKALSIEKSAKGENHKGLVLNYYNIGAYHLENLTLDSAQYYFDKALKIALREDGNPIDFRSLGTLTNALGLIQKEKGNYKLAESFFTKAFNYFEKTYKKGHPNFSNIYNNLGLIYDLTGDYKKALNYYNKAFQIAKSNLVPNSIGLSKNYTNIGSAYHALRNYELSNEYFKKALKIQLLQLGENHLYIATAYNNLSVNFKQMKLFDSAQYYLEKSLELRLKKLPPDHPSIPQVYHNLGGNYLDRGEYNKAIENLNKAIAIREKNYSNGHPDLALSYRALASVYMKMKDYDKVLEQINKAQEAIKYRDIKKIENVLSYRQLLSNMDVFAESIIKKYYLHQNQDDLEKALEACRDYLRVLDYGIREFSQDSKLRFANYIKSTLDARLSLSLVKMSDPNNSSLSESLFSSSERSKAYLLYQSMQDANALQFAGIPDSLLEKEYNLRVDINYFEKQKQDQINAGLGETDSIVLDYSSRLFDLRQEYTALKSQLESSYPDYYRLKYDLAVVDVPAVQSELLTDSTTLLEYFVGDSSVYIFTLNQTDYQVIEVDKDSTFNDLINQMRKGLYASFTSKDSTDLPYRENPTFAAEQYAAAAYDLYQILVQPVEDQLKDKVIIIPDGVLGYIPFQALLKEKPSAAYRYHSHHYFGNDHRISYSYSATLLKEMHDKQHKNPAPKSLLAVAPYYDGTEYLLDSLYNEEMKALGIDKSLATREGFETLENSGPEAKAISELWQGDMLINDQATEQNFTDMAGQYRQLHMATHGKANDRVGEYAFLAFSEIPDSIENELLYVKDIYNLSLNADLVVLSACETGIGELQRGEGIVSLARAFAYAGAKSIFTTLWSVNDAKTKDLMLDFHRQLKAGDEKDVALWKAQQQFLQKHKGQAAHPYYWAGFVGVGDMRNID
jgi:CHAT domain-containing protein/Tfp pilus assembly protein PilF